MNKRDIRKKIGNRIRAIRCQYDNDRGRTMTQGEFTKLFNETEPLDIEINDVRSVGQYERGEVSVPGEKYEKFLILDKENK